MAHPEQAIFCEHVKARYPQYFRSTFVLDIGCLDINGNNHYLLEGDSLYLGCDIAPGKNVDLITPAHLLKLPDFTFDIVISAECLEHDRHWAETLRNATRLLKPGGLLLITCATTGRPEHGTRRTSPQDAPLLQTVDDEWADYYRNLTQQDFESALDLARDFQNHEFSFNEKTHDIYFFGIKKGTFLPSRQRSISLASHPKNRVIQKLEKSAKENEAKAAHLQRTVSELELQLEEILSSRSWRITAPLRNIFGLARRPLARPLLRRARNALKYAVRGDWQGLRDRLRFYRKEASLQQLMAANGHTTTQDLKFGIITPPHTLYLAELIATRLRAHGWTAEIITSPKRPFKHDFYFVLCAQIFDRLPPLGKCITYQLEQSVSSRWFTPAYFGRLNQSLAVLDYSLNNIEFLQERGIRYPHTHYLPIGTLENLAPLTEPQKLFDILFYGDSKSSPRRQKMLAVLQQNFKVHIINDVFGDQVRAAIRQSRMVINLHYYENALLEMPRIQECLSLGVPVVSEAAQDQSQYPEIQSAVRFFKEGSAEDMITIVRDTLDHPPTPLDMQQAIEKGNVRFQFMFDRFLIAMGFLPLTQTRQMISAIPSNVKRLALSLPETIDRRKAFESIRPQECHIFDGIRRSPGWVGCGLSYQTLAKHALDHQLPYLEVMEDDVILPSDFTEKRDIIHAYLSEQGNGWDVFSGVIAAMHAHCEVLEVHHYQGVTFATINKMTSMVYNIYSPRFMHKLLEWDPSNLDSERNTIDRFIEGQIDLRVVVAIPYLVGHREEVQSTLWGFQNTQYIDMIAQSEKELQAKVDAFIKKMA